MKSKNTLSVTLDFCHGHDLENIKTLEAITPIRFIQRYVSWVIRKNRSTIVSTMNVETRDVEFQRNKKKSIIDFTKNYDFLENSHKSKFQIHPSFKKDFIHDFSRPIVIEFSIHLQFAWYSVGKRDCFIHYSYYIFDNAGQSTLSSWQLHSHPENWQNYFTSFHQNAPTITDPNTSLTESPPHHFKDCNGAKTTSSPRPSSLSRRFV